MTFCWVLRGIDDQSGDETAGAVVACVGIFARSRNWRGGRVCLRAQELRSDKRAPDERTGTAGETRSRHDAGDWIDLGTEPEDGWHHFVGTSGDEEGARPIGGGY